MALDATILDVTRDGADLVLTLGPRIDDADKLSITGQPKLRILNATWTPEPGMDIWGGGSSAQIITKRGERDRISVYVEPDGGAFHAFNPAFQGLHVDLRQQRVVHMGDRNRNIVFRHEPTEFLAHI